MASSLDMSAHTIRNYIDILQNTYMLRVLEPFSGNLKKRLIKSPKIYIRDTGILHALLDIHSINDLFGHPAYGASWEGFIIEQILNTAPHMRGSFYRNSNGNEIDLILEYKNKRIAIECKASSAPDVGKGLKMALDELKIKQAWIIAQVNEPYPYNENITISPLSYFINNVLLM